jgi:hypothetical protein
MSEASSTTTTSVPSTPSISQYQRLTQQHPTASEQERTSTIQSTQPFKQPSELVPSTPILPPGHYPDQHKSREEEGEEEEEEPKPVTSINSSANQVSRPPPSKPVIPVNTQQPQQQQEQQQEQQQSSSSSGSSGYSSSDDEESDEEEGGSKKNESNIPSWARSSNLRKALIRQYVTDPMDPDLIFPPVSTCDLQDIFKVSKGRYKNRTSSANWSQDQLTLVETRQYREEMGFRKKDAPVRERRGSKG